MKDLFKKTQKNIHMIAVILSQIGFGLYVVIQKKRIRPVLKLFSFSF